MQVEARLEALGLVLPAPLVRPLGVRLPFTFVRVHGDRAYVAGHPPQAADGTIARPLGKVGIDLTLEEGYQAARLTALSMLGSLKRELGDLDRVTWLRVFGMVNCAPDFTDQPAVINGCTDLILELFGPERGQHARSAVGLTALPFGIPVEIEAEVALS